MNIDTSTPLAIVLFILFALSMKSYSSQVKKQQVIDKENLELKKSIQSLQEAIAFICKNLIKFNELFQQGYLFTNVEQPSLLIRRMVQEDSILVEVVRIEPEDQTGVRLSAAMSIIKEGDYYVVKNFWASNGECSKALVFELIRIKKEIGPIRLKYELSNPVLEKVINRAGKHWFENAEGEHNSMSEMQMIEFLNNMFKPVV